MKGIDKLFTGMRISSSGLTAERTRIDTIAENIANARTTRTSNGTPYRRKIVVFEPLVAGALQSNAEAAQSDIRVNVVEDMSSPSERVLDPSHPDADSDGMVEYPNVNTVLEMSDLITALRAYEANLTAQQNFVRMAERALELAR